MRNFFVTGLNLLDIIHSLRNEDDEDLIIQCDVFDDEKTADDEALSAEMNLDVDVTNHRALFDAVFQKVRRARVAMPTARLSVLVVMSRSKLASGVTRKLKLELFWRDVYSSVENKWLLVARETGTNFNRCNKRKCSLGVSRVYSLTPSALSLLPSLSHHSLTPPLLSTPYGLSEKFLMSNYKLDITDGIIWHSTYLVYS